MRLTRSLTAAFLGAVLFTATLSASADTTQPPKLDAIRTQQAEIREGVMNRTGRYRGMDENKRNELLRKQDFVLRAIEGKQTADEVPEDTWLEVFNSLEWIEAAINNADGERMICTKMRTTGSNMPTRVCKTAEQMRIEREFARKKRDDHHGL
jgi:hypothetical protein